MDREKLENAREFYVVVENEICKIIILNIYELYIKNCINNSLTDCHLNECLLLISYQCFILLT